jgi:hypothetical protein
MRTKLCDDEYEHESRRDHRRNGRSRVRQHRDPQSSAAAVAEVFRDFTHPLSSELLAHRHAIRVGRGMEVPQRCFVPSSARVLLEPRP